MASIPGSAEGAVDRFLIREVVERYLLALDEKDWDASRPASPTTPSRTTTTNPRT
jgi:hypothetical protein